jgi:2-polyprenyl-3-methyl-5-hydroxy-6-metoxy-1,4-benzoquinol methylase
MLALAGDVAGRRILDAGCGAGPPFAALRDRGAIVSGFDASTLPYADGAFDDVIASLVLHYCAACSSLAAA